MKKNDWITVLVVGLVSGLVALLFAPKSGKRMRRDIKHKALDTKDSVQEGAEHLVDDFKDSYFEAVDEVEKELSNLDNRQKELRKTISSIEGKLSK